MDRERWQKVKQILEQALELPTGERSGFVANSCDHDTQLQDEVMSLLDETGAAEALESHAYDHLAPFEDTQIGEEVGHFKLLELIGTGGMGRVYLAERSDGTFEQKVALKLIRHGFDSEEILRRFSTERQILASLKHPNIAHLIDGGTTRDGSPYLVMEYVVGKPITEYANENELGTNARIKLFSEVCSAVSFAHQNLVIHRDLKPTNILVASDGTPKLLDFGIAKFLGSESLDQRTATQTHVFTPEYASPEQVMGENLATTTDIYSLGVILYELLTGERPYKIENSSIGELIRSICETEPTAPSKSRPKLDGLPGAGAGKLKGDLDNIVLKALRKEPEKRYSSAQLLSDDIQRHLVGLPVSASKDTWMYRATKFVRRNKVTAIAASVILITLLGGLFATLYQRNKAQQRFTDVRQLANSFLFEFHDSIADLPGATPARELVVKRSLEYLDRLSQESGNDSELRRELATAYSKIALIQGNSYHANLGDTDGAMKSYLLSLEIRQALVDADPKNRELRQELSDSLEGVGDMHYTVNELERALESYQKAIVILEQVVAEEPSRSIYKYALAGVVGKRGDVSGMEGFPNLGDTATALESYQRGVQLYEEIIAAEPENEKFRSGYATMLLYHGMLLNSTGHSARSVENGRRSISIFRSLTAANPNNAKYETHMMSGLVFMRYPLVEEKLFDEALANANLVIETMEKQVKSDPKNAFNRRSLGVAYNALGRIQTAMKDGNSAVANHEKALLIAKEIAENDNESGENNRDVALTREFMAEAQSLKGDCSAAIVNYREALKVHNESEADASATYAGLATCLATTGKTIEAVEAIRNAISSIERLVAKSPMNTRNQTRLAVTYFEGSKILANFARGLQNTQSEEIKSEARSWLESSSRILNELSVTGKLSKLNANYPTEVAAEIKRITL